MTNALLLSLSPDVSRPASSRWPDFFRAWLPVFLFAILFAIESTAIFGSNRTSAPLHSFCRSLFGTRIDHNWTYIHHMLRKTGHFAGCGLFSLVCFRGFRLTLREPVTHLCNPWLSHVLAIAATFSIAAIDEIHQCFLPNRTGSFRDVLLDTAGVLAAQLVIALMMRFATSTTSSKASSRRSASILQPAI